MADIRSPLARNIVVLTGAGISTSAGIPDFRSPDTGLYANLQELDLPFPEAVFELNFFRENPKPFWTLAKEIYPGKHYVRSSVGELYLLHDIPRLYELSTYDITQPTATHYFLALLARHTVLERVFTQNIDTLEHLAGLSPSKIVEAHGSFATAHCLTCRTEASTEHVLKSGVRRGEVVRCAEKGCEGLVKPDIVFFGEGLPKKFYSAARVS